jgi:DNA-binding MarR family transcriptional regulator
MKNPKVKDETRIPKEAINRIIHEPARFLILAHLYVVKSMDFIFLMNQTGLTQGNLSAHLSKLESAGYISIKKEFVKKRPHTLMQITDKGKMAFRDYRNQMQVLLDTIPD